MISRSDRRKEAGMGRVILCMGSTAKTPYVLEDLGLAVYTVEELCYCIREKAFLMSEKLVCRELIDWLRTECAMTELADSLYGFLRTKASASAFLTTILEYTGYYPPEEIKKVELFLKTADGQDETEKKKQIADYLARSGKYQLALKHYLELLADIPQEDAMLRAKLLHNIGYVECQLFLFEKAAGHFAEAYGLSGEKESLLQQLAAKRLLLSEGEYVDLIAKQAESYYDISMELEMRIEELAQEWEKSRQAQHLRELKQSERQPEEYQDILEDETEQLKERYRGMVREK